MMTNDSFGGIIRLDEKGERIREYHGVLDIILNDAK